MYAGGVKGGHCKNMIINLTHVLRRAGVVIYRILMDILLEQVASKYSLMFNE